MGGILGSVIILGVNENNTPVPLHLIDNGLQVSCTEPESEWTTEIVTLTLADTEYFINIPDGCLGFEFTPRTNDMRFAFETGRVAAPTDPYRTLSSGSLFYDSGNFPAFTIFFASSSAGTVVEVGYKV